MEISTFYWLTVKSKRLWTASYFKRFFNILSYVGKKKKKKKNLSWNGKQMILLASPVKWLSVVASA